MSLKETIESFLAENSSELESAFFHEGITDYGDYPEMEEELQQAGIDFECVEQEGGEGEGDQYHTVYKFTKGAEEVFVKFHGWYASYHGSEMNGYNIVTPKQKVITVYE
jgi:hypothetical protein